MNAAKFYWAIVGDAGPEPVAVVEENGKQLAYTCGCNDPFEVGKDIELIPNSTDPYATLVENLRLPMTPKARVAHREEVEKRLQSERRRGIVHKHRGFSPKQVI